MSSRYYTTREVSAAMGVSQAAVREWAAKGYLPSVRIGPLGRLRFPAEAVREAIEAKARPRAGEPCPA